MVRKNAGKRPKHQAPRQGTSRPASTGNLIQQINCFRLAVHEATPLQLSPFSRPANRGPLRCRDKEIFPDHRHRSKQRQRPAFVSQKPLDLRQRYSKGRWTGKRSRHRLDRSQPRSCRSGGRCEGAPSGTVHKTRLRSKRCRTRLGGCITAVPRRRSLVDQHDRGCPRPCRRSTRKMVVKCAMPIAIADPERKMMPSWRGPSSSFADSLVDIRDVNLGDERPTSRSHA